MGETYVLVGPPGCGKTTEVGRLVRAAVESGRQVLLASLTKAAARELAGRDLGIDEQRIGTLHAHAYRALGGPTIAEGKAAEWNEWLAGIEGGYRWRLPASASGKRSVDDPYDSGTTPADSLATGIECLELAGVYRAQRRPIETWPTSGGSETKAFHAAWCAWKDETGYLDFTDLIERCLTEHIPPALSFDALYLDEAQDIDLLSMSLALQWAALGRALVVAGDPFQNLFSWRGSDPAVFEALLAGAKRTRTLSQSYRVPRAVHAVASAWVKPLIGTIDYAYAPRDFEGAVRRSSGRLKDPGMLAMEVNHALQRDKSVMVLASCSFMLDPLLRELRERGVPYHNPYRTRNGRWNPLHVGRGTGTAGRVLAFSRVSERHWGTDARFWEPAELAAWAELVDAKVWTKKGDITALKSERDYYLDPAWLAERVRNPADLERMFAGDLSWLRERSLPSKAAALDFPLRVASVQGVRALAERPRVIVGTIHSVKGGEADVVIVLPDLSMAGMDDWERSPAAVRRLFYVAMTRARDELVQCDASSMRAVVW